MNNEVMFSKNSDEWTTPQNLFDTYNLEFNFGLDISATKDNTKCNLYFTKEDSALNKNWSEFMRDSGISDYYCWMNPPYSQCKDFIKKAYEENLKGIGIVALVPSRTDTRWFHDYIYKKDNIEIRFLKGRLKFSDSKNAAPFPSMIVIFKRK